MIEIEKPTITKFIDEEGAYGKFVVEPLERGYGTTLGNCMRRILLSSLPGAAVTSVKIDGILHEFSTIPGVKEDVTEIILNLKKLAVRLNGENANRDSRGKRYLGHGDQSGAGKRLCACGSEQDRKYADFGYSGGFHLHAGSEGQLYG